MVSHQVLLTNQREIPKISPRFIFFERPFWRGLSKEGNLHFKIDWASRKVERKFTVFALFYFAFGAISKFKLFFQGGLIFGGAYTWRGLVSEF